MCVCVCVCGVWCVCEACVCVVCVRAYVQACVCAGTCSCMSAFACGNFNCLKWHTLSDSHSILYTNSLQTVCVLKKEVQYYKC